MSVAVEDTDLLETARDLRQQILLKASVAEDGALQEEAFTDWAIDFLEERGEVAGGECCPCEAPRVGKVSGYWLDVDAGQFTVFISLYSGSESVERLAASDVGSLLTGAARFITKCRAGWHRGLEESSPGFALGEVICSIKLAEIDTQFVILTDHTCPRLPDTDIEIEGRKVSWSVWDIERFHRILTSGKEREEITINFADFGSADTPLACVRMPLENPVYETYLAIMPGKMLADIYRKFGPRLLEQNVRSFLQARGKVNKGIRETILHSPEMFLAYNNGLCATAARIEKEEGDGALVHIRSVTDFQIVNGGQTTASLTSAVLKDGADLSQVMVQVKLSVIRNPDHVSEIVGNIARYANSQNKVSEADLLSNDAFHTQVEQLSRTVWAPSHKDANRETKWFYERARGQYNDERGRHRTEAQIRIFETEYPRAQWFTKTDLAKFENTWDQLPHTVSRGAQKNFTEFTIRLNARNGFSPDVLYFQRLVAKAILFRTAERIVSKIEDVRGYRANIVTYSIAWISHRSAKGIDLDRIWSQQCLDQALCDLIQDVARGVLRLITDSGGANVTEYCKKEACWDRIRTDDLGLSAHWTNLLDEWKQRGNSDPNGIGELAPEQTALIDKAVAQGAETWLALSKWASETSSLQGWQRKIAYSVGVAIRQKGKCSVKQAIQAEKIMNEATRLGFTGR